jgi:hypothetical protein
VTGIAFSQKIDSYLATKIGAGRALELRKRPECRQRGKRRRRILSRAAGYPSIKNGPIAALKFLCAFWVTPRTISRF